MTVKPQTLELFNQILVDLFTIVAVGFQNEFGMDLVKIDPLTSCGDLSVIDGDYVAENIRAVCRVDAMLDRDCLFQIRLKLLNTRGGGGADSAKVELSKLRVEAL